MSQVLRNYRPGKTSIAKTYPMKMLAVHYSLCLNKRQMIKCGVKNAFHKLNDCTSAIYRAVLLTELERIILDIVLLDIPEFPQLYDRLIKTCAGTKIFSVPIYRLLDEYRKRNIERGDRSVVGSEWKNTYILVPPCFMSADTTTTTSKECANVVKNSRRGC